MSMQKLTILQFIQIFGCYFLMTVCVPAAVFGNKLKNRRLVERFFFYFMTGNFYLINLVFLLQLLHISNRVMLILGTVLPVGYVWSRNRQVSVRKWFVQRGREGRRIMEGKLGIRTVCLRVGILVKKGLYHAGAILRGLIRGHGLDWLLTGILSVWLLYIYGTPMITSFGYSTSDMPVHTYWINYLSRNHIFVAGVYPFGFHCMIYYLHEVFGTDTYVVLRVFALVQCLFIHGVLLAFLKGCCKSRYTPYIGMFIYTMCAFRRNTYGRYFSCLPQEFGMLFILPAAYFAFRFFQVRSEEPDRKSIREKRQSDQYLAGFAMSFSMTLAAHFYDTMIAGLFCVGIAAGYLLRFIKKKYFVPVVATCFISVMIAVLPMAAAVAMGTPLEPSLNWGMSVIKGEKWQEEAQTADVQEEPEEPETEREPLTAEKLLDGILTSISESILEERMGMLRGGVLLLTGILLLEGILFQILRHREYGCMLTSVAVYMGCMLLLMASTYIGLPPLMEEVRSSIYFTYALAVVLALSADGGIYLFFNRMKKEWVMNAFALAAAACSVCVLWKQGWVKTPGVVEALESNEAVTCLTNIIKEEKDFSWTICSANDELRMGEDHGYHYETITFLESMEENGKYDEMIIPTETVYFFIEKIPLNYGNAHEESGNSVSPRGAKNELPKGSGISVYKERDRWIVMSRMYYWAQEFQKLYPNEMTVYLETDSFVCYKVEQNMNHFFNFAIDYGYNVPGMQG